MAPERQRGSGKILNCIKVKGQVKLNILLIFGTLLEQLYLLTFNSIFVCFMYLCICLFFLCICDLHA